MRTEAGPGPSAPVLPDRLVAILRRKWACPLLVELRKGPKGFRELARSVPKLRRAVLAGELLRLTGEGLVLRKEVSTRPRRVSYRLTSAGASLCDLLEHLRRWEVLHLPPGGGAEV